MNKDERLISFSFHCPVLPQVVALVILAALLSGCALNKLNDAREEFYQNQPEKAAEILTQLESYPKRDRLLFLMERGVIEHRIGRYQESIKAFLEASNLMDQQEIISVSQQAGSLVTTEWITEYKGEYSERLWVHTYLMMNYLLVNKFEDALVEAKQALQVFEDHAEPLDRDFFTKALIALCFDSLSEYNGALIEYKKLAEQLPDPSAVAADLYRLAMKLGMADEAETYKEQMPYRLEQLSGPQPPGELVLFVKLGRAPKKVPGNIVLPPSIRFSFPMYESSREPEGSVEARSPGAMIPSVSVSTDVGEVAKAALKARAAKMMVKETARVAAKEALARSVEESSGDLAGAVARIILFVSEEPDTRSWQTLPARMVLVRMLMRPGVHTVSLIVGGYGMAKETINLNDIEIFSGQRVFRSVRR